ncbi:DinI family protein [Salmonella enterica]|uniref:DinI family protein n=3 Tax=Salmonella enterica TaxID=28901 RepID=A0A722QK61_SALER|nr:DinI family protein [Salmonella enterica subsp. enterica serovar Give]EAM1085378.1 DinI family protein [Salmonella enterica]EBW5437979.1 DinI family protein [Salmonella enterica subsp. enterica serovar Amsterdam]EBZ8208671.1 DinI family protein [Salmonella enterica subsp. enterica serovar Zanzibar]ECB6249354.1 DinI family protein [Salmonella enterica subsp. enterica serovar London]ECH8034123.1 DinI family protein [Salmonella enterica subsp. enterica]ECY9996394.1 DinI family protein [Salmon
MKRGTFCTALTVPRHKLSLLAGWFLRPARIFDGLPGAKNIILGELTKMVHRIFPDDDIRVKPMMTMPVINTGASKHEKEQISRTVQEKFEEAEMWLISD